MNGFEDGLYYDDKIFPATDENNYNDDDDCDHDQVDYNHESCSW